MNAIDLLVSDHRTAEDVFQQFEQSRDDAERRKLVDSMIRELSIHAAIEERELYPFMARKLPDAEPVHHAEHEHAEAKAMLASLLRLQPGDEQFDEMANQLISDVRHHVEEEENELFPKLRDVASGEELDECGQRLEQAKSDAPTRPSAEELTVLTVDELQQFAQKLQIEGRSDLNKDELAAAIAPS